MARDRRCHAMTGTSSAGNVLVVDDTLENLRLLSSMLGRARLRGAPRDQRPAGAAGRASTTRPISSCSTSTCRRWTATRSAGGSRRTTRSQDVPVIFLTALTDTADKVRAFDAGGVDYITKPFQVEEVLARVKYARRAQARADRAGRQLRAPARARAAARRSRAHGRARHAVAAVALSPRPRAARGPRRRARRRQRRAICRQRSSRRMQLSRMANDLLDVSRLEEGRMPLEPSGCDLTRMADEVRAALGELDRERADRHRQPARGRGDVRRRTRPARDREPRQQRHQAHAGRQPDTHFGRGRDRGRARVAVHDEGRGVPPEASDEDLREVRRPSARGTSGSTTRPGWASRSASSRSRPMAEPSAWIPACRRAARSGSSCRGDPPGRTKVVVPA